MRGRNEEGNLVAQLDYVKDENNLVCNSQSSKLEKNKKNNAGELCLFKKIKESEPLKSSAFLSVER